VLALKRVPARPARQWLELLARLRRAPDAAPLCGTLSQQGVQTGVGQLRTLRALSFIPFAAGGPAWQSDSKRNEVNEMSRAFVKEENEALTDEALPERPVSAQPNYVTPAGLEQLRAKVDALHAEHVRLKRAAEDFDRPRLSQIERDLRYYQAKLDSAIPVDISTQPRDEVRFGASVQTEDENGGQHEFTLVGEDEADVTHGKVSWHSPLAVALMGAKVGDTVTWNRPAGAMTLEVLGVRYAE
jgi:transcription elongation factor GreB